MLQPPIRPVPAKVILLWKGPPKLHRMSPCNPVSVPAKITWERQKEDHQGTNITLILTRPVDLFLIPSFCQIVKARLTVER